MTNNSLEAMSGFDFADWLYNGFKNWQTNQLEPFKPLHNEIRRLAVDDNVISALGNIYDQLPKNTQQKFRNGIVKSLYYDLLPSERPILKYFLHLAGRIEAPEIIPVIVYWTNTDFLNYIQEGDYGIDKRAEFFALVVDIVAGLAGATDVSNVLKMLARHELFSFKYTPMIFVALCRTEPNNFLMHLLFTEHMFKELHREYDTEGAHITAKRVAHYVPLDIIQENLDKMDKWLLHAFFIDEKAPLKIVKKN